MREQLEDYIEQAIHQVEAWDLPEEQFAQAVNNQAFSIRIKRCENRASSRYLSSGSIPAKGALFPTIQLQPN